MLTTARLFIVGSPVLGALLLSAGCGGHLASVDNMHRARIEASPQFKDGVFVNRLPSDNPIEQGGGWSMLGRWFDGQELRRPTQPIEVVNRSRADFATLVEPLRVTWLGHSSMLIEIDGRRVLTDPIWSERASPVTFAGPKRFHDPPLALDQLPQIHAVIISHDHYDHLDEPTIKALSKQAVSFYVPLGVGAHLRDWGVPDARVIELDWWERASVGDVELVAVPARHRSGRGPLDIDRTLWASWAVLGPQHRVFFSGDTGYHNEFVEIGRRLGPFDITLMESGAYNAMWRDSHMGPEQALRAHRELRGELMVPIHWGTFNLGLHAWTEPAERLLAGAHERDVRLALPRPGESVTPEQIMVARWWPPQPWQSAAEAPVVSSQVEPETRLAVCPPEQRAAHGPELARLDAPDSRCAKTGSATPVGTAAPGVLRTDS